MAQQLPFRKAASLAWSNIRPNSSAPLRPYVPSKKPNILDPLHQQHSLKRVQEEDSQSEAASAAVIRVLEEEQEEDSQSEAASEAAIRGAGEHQEIPTTISLTAVSALRLAMAESVTATTSSSF